jgi:hypothetical protein
MKRFLTEDDLKMVDQRRLLQQICNEYEIYHPDFRTGIDAVAFVTNNSIRTVKRCLEGTWRLSFKKWQKIEAALGCRMWDRYQFFLFQK